MPWVKILLTRAKDIKFSWVLFVPLRSKQVEMQTIEGSIHFSHRHSQAICQAMCQAIVFHGHTRGQEILHEGPTIETEGGILWYPVVLRLELLYPQKAMQNDTNTQI